MRHRSVLIALCILAAACSASPRETVSAQGADANSTPAPTSTATPSPLAEPSSGPGSQLTTATPAAPLDTKQYEGKALRIDVGRATPGSAPTGLNQTLAAASGDASKSAAAGYFYGGGAAPRGVQGSATATKTVPATDATIIVMPTFFGGPDNPGPPTVSKAQRAKVVAELGSLGIGEANVRTNSSDSEPYGYGVRVSLAADRVRELGPKIVAAIERALGVSSQMSGVVWSLKDCAALERELAARAAADARKNATDLAAAAGVDARTVVWLTGGSMMAIPGQNASCGGSMFGAPMPFDSTPETTVSYSMTLALASNLDAQSAIGAGATAGVSIIADSADIVINVSANGPPNQVQQPDKAKINAALIAAGFREADVKFAAQFGSLSITISRQLAATAGERAQVARDTVRSNAPGFVYASLRFRSNDCEKLVAEARRLAVAEAAAQAGALAQYANVKVGVLLSLQDSTTSYYGGGPCSEDQPFYFGRPSSFDEEPIFRFTTFVQAQYRLSA